MFTFAVFPLSMWRWNASIATTLSVATGGCSSAGVRRRAAMRRGYAAARRPVLGIRRVT
jgi:hypothetical protein